MMKWRREREKGRCGNGKVRERKREMRKGKRK